MSCTVQACRICLATGTKLYNYNHYELKLYYEQIMTSNVKENDGLPCYFCYECAAMLHKFHKFKEKCFVGQKLLKQLNWKEPLTLQSVRNIKKQTKSLQPSLNIVTINPKVKTVVVRPKSSATANRSKQPPEIEEPLLVSDDEEDDDDNSDSDDKGEIPPLPELINVDKKEDLNETKINIIEEKPDEDIKIVIPTQLLEDIDKDFSDDDDRVLSDYNIQDYGAKEPDEDKEYIPEKKKRRNTRASNKKKTTEKVTEKKTTAKAPEEKKEKRFKKNAAISERKYDLNLDNWLKINLTEEQAIEEFKSRALQKRYVSAQFRCDLCLKGFSKADILRRHNDSRHVDSIGPIECRFCHMRFRYKSFLSRHIRQHYTKYKCLRCDLVCPFESTAQLHEQYHNGVTKKCAHCGEEFKHITTYYTHLRTHRSEHVCPLCGEAFISPLGLKMHQKKKHVKSDTAKSEGPKEEQEFCKRCNIKFETKKAYDEHLIHSAMHVDGIEDVELESPVISNPKKIRQNMKRHNIPTDCHICGQHFVTQTAARKHHLAEHPRAANFAPNQRLICEICGASLAPNSVNSHLNTHTREKKFACSTCGRQFITKGGLTMHQLTHSSVKPVACTLCDKRFKQVGSMRLHYRTFHLKEPYPKRSRTKKNTESQEIPLFEDFSEDYKDEKIMENKILHI